MDATDDILSQIPLDQLAAQLGTDPATAEAAVRQVVPGLVGGMQANATDEGGANSLVSALEQHAASPLFDTGSGSGVDLDAVDTQDGEKIVSHVFGGNADAVATRLAGATGLAGSTGAGGEMIKKLLPILAPIVIGYLAKQVFNRDTAAAGQAGGQGGGGLMDMLGSVLGGSGLGGSPGGLFGGGDQQGTPAPAGAPAGQSGGPFNAAPQGAGAPFDLPATQSEPQQQSPQPGGGIMDILGDLLGQGRRG